jgi:Flp pilus assembly protein TadD
VLKSAVAEHPQDTLLLDEFCKHLFQHGSVEETEQYLRRFHELQPENSNISENLGAICFRQQRYEEAAHWLELALKHNPKSAEAHLYLGETLHQLGRAAEARSSWNEAARLAERGHLKEQALTRLRDIR